MYVCIGLSAEVTTNCKLSRFESDEPSKDTVYYTSSFQPGLAGRDHA